jgi:hypothetical protein
MQVRLYDELKVAWSSDPRVGVRKAGNVDFDVEQRVVRMRYFIESSE